MRKAYPAVLDSLDALRTDADAFCAENRIDADSVFALNLCLEEVFSNSAIYGCGLSPDKKIEVSLYFLLIIFIIVCAAFLFTFKNFFCFIITARVLRRVPDLRLLFFILFFLHFMHKIECVLI